MKQTKQQTNKMKIALLLSVIAIIALSLVSCEENVDSQGLWASATYLTDTTIGEGENTVKVEIAAGDKSIILTVKTDKEILGDALYELGVVNDPSFFDTCNGIKADFDKDKSYWGFYVNGVAAMYGIGDSKATTTGTDAYKLVYTK